MTAPHIAQTHLDAARLERLAREDRERHEKEKASETRDPSPVPENTKGYS